MATNTHWLLMFVWVLSFKKLIVTTLIYRYFIHRVLVTDEYLYSRVYMSIYIRQIPALNSLMWGLPTLTPTKVNCRVAEQKQSCTTS